MTKITRFQDIPRFPQAHYKAEIERVRALLEVEISA
jgi:hypothetical protein